VEVSCGHRSGALARLAFAMPGVTAAARDGGMRVTLPPWSVAILAWPAD
nr:hypothetical protein [Planctomycetota bacterium]